MTHSYTKYFELKDVIQRTKVNLACYSKEIKQAEDEFNKICSRTPNKKKIEVKIFRDHLEIEIFSEKPLKQGRLGNSLRLFSQILVQKYGFLGFCTNTTPRKLFVTI